MRGLSWEDSVAWMGVAGEAEDGATLRSSESPVSDWALDNQIHMDNLERSPESTSPRML